MVSSHCRSLSLNFPREVYGTAEDCHVIDVYRPHNLPRRKLLPVMVFLHGGALSQGAASHYPADRLVQQSDNIVCVYISSDDVWVLIVTRTRQGLPVIAVVINYRLAAWGFLYVPDCGSTPAPTSLIILF